MTELTKKELTPKELSDLYDECNREFFDNLLKKIPVGYSNWLWIFAGCYFVMLKKIKLNRPMLVCQPLIETKNTLLHEMCHQYVEEVLGGEILGHGAKFRSVANIINQMSSEINV
jgi:predicted SprT family Zn-dependent metalloprotease